MAAIFQAIAQAQARGLDRLDAQLLMLHALGKPPGQSATQRAWLLAHSDDAVLAPVQAWFDQAVHQRCAGKPLAYITGHKEFFGLDLRVDPRVLVPRPETETLVEWALEVLPASSTTEEKQQVCALDLGTGSGAIALALKHARPDVSMDATDASSEALEIARSNAQVLGLGVRFDRGSWLSSVSRRYHCIVTNPPYIAAQDAHLPALSHEPLSALVSGPDGLEDIRRIVATGQTCLREEGWLLVEHGFDQAGKVRALFEMAGFRNVASRRDLAGHERCTGGQAARGIAMGRVQRHMETAAVADSERPGIGLRSTPNCAMVK